MQHQEKQKKDLMPKKMKRRTRNDQENRNFQCGCGKSYLSYPALYTHLKQKHEGKPPIGTALPNSLTGRATRGEMHKVELYKQFNNIKDELEARNECIDDLDRSFSSIEPEERIEELVAYLESINYSYRARKQLNLEELISNNFLTGMFHPSDFEKIFQYIKEILQKQDLKIENQVESSEEDQSNGVKRTKINKIFAYFLVEIGPRISQEAFQELTIYIILYAKSLNEIGQQAAELFEKQLAEVELFIKNIFKQQQTQEEEEKISHQNEQQQPSTNLSSKQQQDAIPTEKQIKNEKITKKQTNQKEKVIEKEKEIEKEQEQEKEIENENEKKTDQVGSQQGNILKSNFSKNR